MFVQTDQKFLRPRVGFLPIGNMRKLALQDDYDQGVRLVRTLDADVVESPVVWSQPEVLEGLAELQAKGIDLLVVYVLNGMSSAQQTLAGARSSVPVILWALPTNYSFPSTANAVGVLRERGRRVRMVTGDGDPASVVPLLNMMARVAYTITRLQNSRIGTLGDIFPNLSASHYHPDVLMDRLGPQVIHITLAEFNTFLATVAENDPVILDEIDRFRSRLDVRVDETMLRKALRFHHALESAVEKHRLTAAVLECHTELTPLYGINLCIGFADERCPYLIGCEGDVVMSAQMLMLRYLTGRDSCAGDIYSLREGMLTLMHCGADCRMASDEKAAIMEQNAPDTVGLTTKMAMCVPNLLPGDVTVTRLHGRSCDQLHVASGEVIECDTRERLVLHVRLNNPEGFLEHVCGNHYVVTYGDVRPGLRLLADWLSLDITET